MQVLPFTVNCACGLPVWKESDLHCSYRSVVDDDDDDDDDDDISIQPCFDLQKQAVHIWIYHWVFLYKSKARNY